MIAKKLKNSRLRNWNERNKRSELESILSKEKNGIEDAAKSKTQGEEEVDGISEKKSKDKKLTECAINEDEQNQPSSQSDTQVKEKFESSSESNEDVPEAEEESTKTKQETRKQDDSSTNNDKMQKQSQLHPIHKLQLDCQLRPEQILRDCIKLEVIDAIISWGTANGKFTDFQTAFDWSCENEETELTTCLEKNAEGRPTNRLCTFRKTKEKKDMLNQVWYHCEDCKIVDDDAICNACAKICHDTHKINKVDDKKSFFCKCGANENKEEPCIALSLPQTKEKCTFTETKNKFVLEHAYRCEDCSEDWLCSRCVNNCHKEHKTFHASFETFYCDCDCNYSFDDIDKILLECKNNETVKPIKSWAMERFKDLKTAFDWSCERGNENLTNYLISKSDELETKFNRMCTFGKTDLANTDKLKQVWYHCKDCNMTGKNGICNACAKICHESHNTTIQVGTTNSFICNCGSDKGALCDALVLPRDKKLCTFTETKKKGSPQYSYKCNTCTTTYTVFPH